MLRVTIGECKPDPSYWVSRHRGGVVNDIFEQHIEVREAVDKAVKLRWGRKASFVQDQGLKNCGLFGCVLDGENHVITGRLQVDVARREAGKWLDLSINRAL